MKKISKSLIVMGILAMLIVLPIVSLAESASKVLKKDEKYLIYNESIMESDKDLIFAFEKTKGADKDTLTYYPIAKDANDIKVAYVDETNKEDLENNKGYLVVRDAENNYIINEEEIDLGESIDKDKVDTTTKRISVDTSKTDTKTEIIDGVETVVTTGKVVITDNKDAKYSYIIFSGNDKEIMQLAKTLADENAIKDKTFEEKLEMMDRFQNLYNEMEPSIDDNTWVEVENLTIPQPESEDGEEYIVFIKKVDGNETIIDAQFLTAYTKYEQRKEKETVTIKETSKLPVTFDTTITLFIVLALVIVAIVVVLIVRNKTNKKEGNK